MFIISYFLLFLLFVLYSLKKENKLINFLTLFGLGYCIFPVIAIVISEIGSLRFFKLSEKTNLLILFSGVAFFVSYVISSPIIKKLIKLKKVPLESFKKRDHINIKIMIMLNVFAWIFVLPYTIKSIEIIKTDGLNYLRDYATAGYLFNNTKLEVIYIWIIFPIFIVSGIYAALMMNRWRNKKVKLFICVTIISLLIHSFTYAARALIVRYMFYFVVSFFVFNNETKKESKTYGNGHKKIALIVLIIFFCLALYITKERSMSLNTFENVIVYYIGPFHLLNFYVENPGFSKLNEHLYGKATFGFVYNVIEAAKYFIFKSPYKGSDAEITSVTAISVPIGLGIRMNAGSTAIYPFLRDFGLLGIFFGFSLLAIVSNIIKYKYQISKTLRNKAVYLMFMYIVFRLSSSYLELFSPEFLFCLFYIILFSTNLKKENYGMKCSPKTGHGEKGAKRAAISYGEVW